MDRSLPEPVELQQRLAKEKELAAKTISAKAKRFWIRYNGDTVLWQAALALILVIVSPSLIRLFLWFVLAPVAMRRPMIRLAAPGRPTTSIPAAGSRVSVAVRLSGGEELLVRQDYLQASSATGTKQTQWFLDWKRPITSFATGLRLRAPCSR